MQIGGESRAENKEGVEKGREKKRKCFEKKARAEFVRSFLRKERQGGCDFFIKKYCSGIEKKSAPMEFRGDFTRGLRRIRMGGKGFRKVEREGGKQDNCWDEGEDLGGRGRGNGSRLFLV